MSAPGGGAGWLAWLAGLLVLGGSVGGGVWYMRNKPHADRKTPEQRVPLVEVWAPARTNACVTVESMGVVLPSREVSLQAEVSARILEIHPMLIEGGVVRAGDVLMRLDASSFEATLLRQRAALATAQANLSLERGHQAVALQDLATMREMELAADVDRALALREPQLAIAQAAVASAQAAVEEAALNVARTTIAAPFDAVVVSADAECGGRGAPGVVFAHLAASEAFWVRAAVPVSRLALIRLPDADGAGGAAATVVLADGRARQGRVIRRLPDVESDARMARVMVEVRDPLAVSSPDAAGDQAPLLLQDYVRVQIQGNRIEDVFRIPRPALHDGNTVWVLNGEDRLHIQTVEVVWGDVDAVLVRAVFPEGARLIRSELAAPVEGMRVRLRAAGEKATAPAVETAGAGPHA